MDRREMLDYGLTFPFTYEDAPFKDKNWQLIRYSPNKKAFLWSYELDGHLCINVKCEPDKAYYWRQIYKSVIPGYHQNKDHWNTIILDGTVPEDAVKLMIADSYDLISDSPTRRIYEAVQKIPRGKVATYKTIAGLAGDPKMARAVGNALHKNPDPEKTPCYRVVNSKGELAEAFVFGGEDVQADMLKKDGIEVNDGKVDLKRFGWEG
ncbi:MAG: methylated-DNA--[protein]-cysteine S-methyltransferase [Lachnospiraceae bacterium]|nr:methylated-DNA--[protein]-cysteine S-methyltransferase [Lachnospiraceae bacterium]